MRITSLQNSFIKEMVALKKNNVRKKERKFLVQGNDFIEFSKKANVAKIIFALEDNNYGIETVLVSEEVLRKISLYENSLEPVILCDFIEENNYIGNKLVYLDGVQDPGNVGTIIRTALAFNYDGLILSPTCASLYSPKVLSSTKGAIFSLNIYQNITLNELKENGYEIIVTSLSSASDFKKVNPSDKFVIVFGSEGQGVSKESLLLANKIIKIEMGNIDSLNVAVASGIILERYR